MKGTVLLLCAITLAQAAQPQLTLSGKVCHCNPGQAASVCAQNGSNNELIVHENCNQFYKCANGEHIPYFCPGTTLYNPLAEICDWPENVQCGDRPIVAPGGGTDSGDSNNSNEGNGGSDNGSVGTCNCNPEEAPALCAAAGSDGVLVAHENCNQFYKCDHGIPVTFNCPPGLLYHPYTEQCDWPHNVECGDRPIVEIEGGGDSGADVDCEDTGNGNGETGGGNGGGDNGGTCNCNPGEAPGICAADGSDGVLVAHENCNQFYKCAHGIPVALFCYGDLLYNPYTEQCDWPHNVNCGDRPIVEIGGGGSNGGDEDCEETGNGNGESGSGGGSGDNGGGDNGGTCNCNPGEAPGICSADGSDGILIAHENCNQFYKCAHGVPVALNCYGNLVYNPYTEQCDWPHNVDCGDRPIVEIDGGGDNGGEEGGNGNGESGSGGGSEDNGGGDNGGTCNCNPGEAPGICAVDGSDGTLVAHENCNQFYKCNHGVPVTVNCPPGLVYNPYIECCDWPYNVDCGDKPIVEVDGGGNGESGGDNGSGGGNGDNGGTGGNSNEDNGGTCNCNPEEAPGICSTDGSDGTLIAHENCNQFYKCAHGTPVTINCPPGLVYNPFIECCDWPANVNCGDKPIVEIEGGGNGDNGSGGGNGDNGSGGGSAGGNSNEDNGGTCNCNPGEAPGICGADGSDGTLIAHENCNQFYKCAHGVPVALNCHGILVYNPYTERCDWPENVDCGDRPIVEIDGGGGDSGGTDNGGTDNGGTDNGGTDNGGTDNGGTDNGGGSCNCNPGEAPGICAADGSDGVLIAHENCNQFYKCAHGVPVALNCYGNLLYNPYTEQCDWPENVDCGERPIVEIDGGGGDNGGTDNGGTDNGGTDNGGTDNGGTDNGGGSCNCNPGEAPGICAADGSDGVLIAHENCNQFYKCAHGVPVALNCYGNLLYNPYTEQCDWPENVDCGNRPIVEIDGGGGDNGGTDNGGTDNGGTDNGGTDNGGTDNGGTDNGGGTCNCNPGEAPGICAADGSDGVLVAHENCNQFYKCAHGVPVALNCYGNLLYNPYTEQCDWPENVDCGNRPIVEIDGGGGDNGGTDNGGTDNGGTDNGGTDNGGGTCNCNPGEAPGICAADGSDGVLVAHENCNQFYKCAHGVPVALNCYGNLLYNPYTEQCDWPENVECGNRPIVEIDGGGGDNGGTDNGGTDNGGTDNGGTDNGGTDNGGTDNGGSDNGGGSCNCNPGEAPGICAADGSDGVLIAHENCNQFYKCAHGVPVALNCYGNLLYNPYTEQCDWPENVECGNRPIVEIDGGGGDNGGTDNGGTDNGGTDNGGTDNGGTDNGGGTCNCNPGEAPGICAADGSDGVLIAHENCNQFYKCAHGVPVALNCYGNLLYNPYTEQCDWPENVDCGNRPIVEIDGGGGDNGGTDNGGTDNGGTDNGGTDNGGGSCNCNPGEAPGICAADGSEGVLIAHENCNQFYKCAHGVPVALNCYGNLLYNPYTEQCDWPENVDCGNRPIVEIDGGGGDNGGTDNGGTDNGGTDNGGTDNGGGSCNCNPGEAPGICAADGSEGVLIAHENCNQFYKCAHGVPVALNCYGHLLYNPYTEQCDWPENVDCGDRPIVEVDGGGGDNGGTDNGGTDNGGTDNGGGSCNCNPGEAPAICAPDGSDGVLIAHENCNQFYKCANGVPVALNCYGNLLYNPYTQQCDWPELVDCGDRVVVDNGGTDNGNTDNGGTDNGGSDNGNTDNGGTDNGGTDNGNTDSGSTDNGGTDSGVSCNCNPEEASNICSRPGSDGQLVAHENCNQFYQCAHGIPVCHFCSGNLLYNPYTQRCDWPHLVECGDRPIVENEGDNEDNGGDNGGGDNGGGDNGTCNCNPEEAPAICGAAGSDGTLVAHENCNQFYMCAHGLPVAIFCSGNLLYNPYTQRCDWPGLVDCGNRPIVENEGGGDDNDGGDNGGTDNGDNNDPSQAPAICAADGSDGILIAHENCNQFYVCTHGAPVTLDCPSNLLYNPSIRDCDWPHNVDCGNRVIPEPDNGGTDEPCACNAREAPAICSGKEANGKLVAHENCNQYYVCFEGVPVARSCPATLFYEPHSERCLWPAAVSCEGRVITIYASLNKHAQARRGTF